MYSLMDKERLDLYSALQDRGAAIIFLDNNMDADTISEILNLNGIQSEDVSGIIFEEAVWNKKLNFSTIFSKR